MSLLKTLVAVLALANAAWFLWAHGIAAAPLGGAPSPPVDTAPLKLASEVAAEGSAASGADTPAGGAAPGGATAVEAAAVRGAAASAAAATADAAGSGLRGEPASGLLTDVKRCLSVGPFRDVAEAAHAATTLRAAGYDPRQRVAEGEVWAGVWVYLAVPADRAAGERMLAKLKTGGIDDVLEMPGPDEAPVYSLGLYSEPKRAQARLAQAQALGFSPALADRKRTGNVYWVDLDLKPTDSLIDPADLRADSSRILRLEVKACPASAGGPS